MVESKVDSKHTLHEGIPVELPGVNAYTKYVRVAALGKGGFGSVYKVRKKRDDDSPYDNFSEPSFCLSCCSSSAATSAVEDNSDVQYYALKVFRKDEGSRSSRRVTEFVQEEAEVLRKLDHPNIVKIYEIFSYGPDTMVVMELCSGGTLTKRSPFTERQCHSIIKSILSAVEYMHNLNIVHRDLKLENILFEHNSPNAQIKILDFGLSEQFDPEEGVHTACGTIYALAPEVFEGDTSDPKKADMWAVGVIAFYLFSHEHPFWGTASTIERKILRCEYTFDANVWRTVSKRAKKFIASLLEGNVRKRLSAREANASAWIQSKSFALETSDKQNEFMAKVQDKILTTTAKRENSLFIQRIACMFIAHNSASKELVKLRRAFNILDIENDGVIRVSDFTKAMKEAGWEQSKIDEAFKNLDFDGDGKIEYTEFISATLDAEVVLKEEMLREAFDRLDLDHTGYIDRNNLKDTLGADYSPALVAQAIEKADKDHDGKISFEDFKALFFEKALEVTSEKIHHSISSQEHLELDPDDSS